MQSKALWVSTSAVAIGLLGISFQTLIRKNWFRVTVSRDNFKADYNHTILSIPTIYYPKGKLLDVLPDWHDERNGLFQLYRLMPGDEFKLDYDILNDGTNVTAKKRISDCIFPQSIMCRPCFEYESASVNAADILHDRQEGGEYSAAFAHIESMSSIGQLWKAMQLPPHILKTLLFEHAFISNFKSGLMTAPMHANALTSSMAVQFVGKKTWIFFSSDVTRNSNMLNAFQVDSVVIPTQSPKDNYDIYVYTSQPGDVLFFAENWGHTVYTHEGPNLMLNFRKLIFMNILRRPIDWIHTILAAALLSNRKPFSNRKIKQTNMSPYSSPYFTNTLKKIQDGLCGDGDVSEWDKVMMKVIHDHVQTSTVAEHAI